MPDGIKYYVVREVGGATRDLAIHRVFDSAVICLQKIIRRCETETGFELWGITTDECGMMTMEWLIYSYQKGDKIIARHGDPAVSRDYVFRRPGVPLRAPSSSLPHREYNAARRMGSRPSSPVVPAVGGGGQMQPSLESGDTVESSLPDPPKLAEI
jgi:hypothetical protein